MTPPLKEAAILQKPETESSTAPPPLNPYFLTPPTVETLSHAQKRKRRCIQFVNYLDDHDGAHAWQTEETSSPQEISSPTLQKKTYKYSRRKIIEFFLSLSNCSIFHSFCNYFTIKFLKGYLVSGLKGVHQSKYNLDIIIPK